MSGQALERPGPAFDTRSIKSVSLQRFVRIKRAGVRFLAGSVLRALVHMALDHVDIINRPTFGTVDIPFPVPKAVRIKVVNSITRLSLKIFFTPDHITHGSYLLL
jgi:hypothetical protein